MCHGQALRRLLSRMCRVWQVPWLYCFLFCLVAWHTIQHHTVATACTRAHRTDDSTQDTACHHPVPIHITCRSIRLGVPDRCYARNRPFIIQGCHEERIWQHSSPLRQSYACRPCIHTRHGWHDAYNMAHHLCHVLWRMHGCRWHGGGHNTPVYTYG